MDVPSSENVRLGYYFADLIFVVCQSTAKIGSLEKSWLYSRIASFWTAPVDNRLDSRISQQHMAMCFVLQPFLMYIDMIAHGHMVTLARAHTLADHI